MLQSDDTFTWDVERTSCRCSVALVQHVSVFITEEFETFKTNWVRKEKRTVQNSTAARHIWSLKLHCDFISTPVEICLTSVNFDMLLHSVCQKQAVLSRPLSGRRARESKTEAMAAYQNRVSRPALVKLLRQRINWLTHSETGGRVQTRLLKNVWTFIPLATELS